MSHAQTVSWIATGILFSVLAITRGEAQDTAADAGATAKKPPLLDLRRITPLHGDAVAGKAKAELCATCHGAQGIAISPLFPNLAGQRPEYLYWQLVEYKRGNVPPTAMTTLAAELSDADMRDIAMYFAGLPLQASASADQTTDQPTVPSEQEQLELGKALYLAGDPAKGIPPCQGCHGADARGFPDASRPNRDGHTPYASYPVLRSQQREYLQTRLDQYRNREALDSSTDMVMSGVAHRLDPDSIAAVSRYLSALRDD